MAVGPGRPDSHTARVTGLPEIVRALQKLPIEIQKKMERGSLKQALTPMKETAEALAPVGETGNLANSFKIRTRTKKGVLVGEVYTKAPHAHLMEYGFWLKRKLKSGRKKILKRVRAHPPKGFMRQALTQNKDRARAIIVKAIAESLRKFESRR